MNNKNIILPEVKSNTYGAVDGLSLQNMFYADNGFFPSAYLFEPSRDGNKKIDVQGLFKHLLETTKTERVNICAYTHYVEEKKMENMGISCIFLDDKLYARFEEALEECYILYPNDKEEEMKRLRDTLLEYYIVPDDANNSVFSLEKTEAGFNLIDSNVKDVEDFNIETQYNDDFAPIDGEIIDFIEEKGESGIIILHGEKGTGKTTYIRHLINTHQDLKFVTIAPNLLEIFSDPSFSKFLQARLRNTVIILEDCEAVVTDRKQSRNSSSVSLLLNLGDGLLSDELGIKFICTFNAETKNIDPALMRKGRLKAEYKFTNLSLDKTKALAKSVIAEKILDNTIKVENLKKEGLKDENKINRLQKKIDLLSAINVEDIKKGMPLADIYNIEDMSFEKEKSRITLD